MTRVPLISLVTVFCAILIATATVAGVGTTATGETSSVAEVEAQIQDQDTNSTDVPHERPDSAAADNNRSALETRLSEQLIDRLTQSAVRIGDGEYEDAQRPVADEYDAELTLYIDVYRAETATDLRQIEKRQELFAETAELQIRYAQTLAEHQRVRAEYQDAREGGDRDRARQRAQELDGLTRNLTRIDESLAVRYQNLSDTTPRSLETASTTIENTTAESTQQTEEAVRRSYTNTNLTAQADTEGSFTSPVRITGQLAGTGDALPSGDVDFLGNEAVVRREASGDGPSGNVTFLVNGRRHTVSVAPDGSFSIPYRPVTEPAATTTIELVYVLDDSGLYLSSGTNVTTTITQDAPTVSIHNATNTTRATSSVTASGRVTGGGVPVPNTPVKLFVGDRQLSETRTTDSGEYQFETSLPADIPTGTQTLSVTAGEENASVGTASEERQLMIEKTETQLSLSANREAESVAITGRLLAGTETGVSGQNVSVVVDGEQVESVQTDGNGGYEAVVDIPQSVNASESVSVQAEFNGSDTNLEGASVIVSLPPPGQRPLPEGMLISAGVIGVGIVCLFAAGWWYYYRRDPRNAGDSSGDSVPPDSISPRVASPFAITDIESADRQRQLDPIRQHLENDNARTALLGLYAAVQYELSSGKHTASTHWEFFEAVAGRLSDGQRSALHDLTEAFETVRFAGEDPDPEEVRALMVETKRHFLGRDNGYVTTDPDTGGLDE